MPGNGVAGKAAFREHDGGVERSGEGFGVGAVGDTRGIIHGIYVKVVSEGKRGAAGS